MDAKGRESEPVCIDGEIPFEIPKGWEWARLGSLFDMQAGKNIAASNISDKADEVNRVPCFGGNGVRGYVAQPNREGNHQIIGRQGALCGCVNYAQGPFYATEHAVVVTAFDKVEDAWTGLILRGLNLNQYATATAQPGLAVSKISEVLAPVPPLAEQRRIAERVSELTPLVEEYGELEDEREALDAALPERLRKSVLQMAVEGKLVAQNPSDEPASVLLGRIREDRARLIAEKKIKAPKGGESVIYLGSDGRRYEKRIDAKGHESEPVCIDDEIPFDIPEGWEWARLEDVCTVIVDCPHSTPKYLDCRTGYFAIDTNCIDDAWNLTGLRTLSKEAYESRTARYVPKVGDLIFTREGSIGRSYILKEDNVCLGQRVMLISCNERCLDSRFCQVILSSPYAWSLYKKENVGTGVKHINVSMVRRLLVPLPPFDEQGRIVAATETILDLITNQ